MKNLKVDDFALFAQIAATRSLSEVARLRNLAPSQVSRALARIEAECQLLLVHRSTHGLSLTKDGQAFLLHASGFVQAERALQTSLDRRSQQVTGTVRLGISQLLAEHVLVAAMAKLHALHPQLRVDLHLDDRLVNLADESIDVAVRAGVAPAGSLVARSLGQHGRALYAAPDYLARAGAPRSIAELAQHSLITNSAVPSHNLWEFCAPGGVPSTLAAKGRFNVNSSSAVVSLAVAGAGIARINDVVGNAWVAQGKLRPVLPDWVAVGVHPIYAVILAERHRAPKIRAVMDFLQATFAAFKPSNSV